MTMENACGSRLVAAVDTSTDMLAVAVARAVVLYENGNLFPRAFRNVDVKVRQTAAPVRRYGVKGVVVGFHRADKTVLEQLADDHHAVHVRDPVVAGRTHVDESPLGKGALHFVKDEKKY